MNIRVLVRTCALISLGALFAGCGGSGSGGVRNDRIYILYYDDLDGKNVLASIDANLPSNVATIGSFNYLTDAVFGLDRRPANGGLYAYSQDDESLLRINANNGIASVVGQNSLDPDTPIGMDFNPVVDRLRIVDRNDINFRVDPSTGNLVAQDTNLGPNCKICDVAYTNNFDGASVTTLFGIDAENDSLVMIGGIDGTPSPNGGAVTQIGPLGISIDSDNDDVQLDIDRNGNAYMLFSDWNGLAYDNKLYLVNLSTGAATLIGTLNIDFEVVGMTAR